MDKNNTNTLTDLLYNSASEYGENCFIRYDNKKDIIDKSFNQFKLDCDTTSAFIHNEISSEKLHIALVGTTSYSYLVGFFGTSVSGNVVVPLDAQLSAEDICDCINRADIIVFMFDSRFSALVPAVRKLCPQLKAIIQLDAISLDENIYSLESILKEYSSKSIQVDISPKECATIIYTSGTTGKSKGVMLSHANLMDNCFCENNESTSDDVLLSVLPIHHVYCMSCDIFLSLRYGSTIAINDNLMHLGKNLDTFKPTKVLLVPMIIQSLYYKIQNAIKIYPNVDPKLLTMKILGGRLKIIFSGGAYLSPKLIENFATLGIKITQGYGMTECSPRISTGFEHIPNEMGSIGRIVNGCEVRIVDGEIQAKSPSVMMGYYKNPDATAETITEDGWLKTGDLGYKDDNGWLFITGRKKNLIILSNGENVSPEEIENKFVGDLLIKEVLVYAQNHVITAEVFPDIEQANIMGITDIKDAIQEKVDSVNLKLTSSKAIRNIIIRECEFEKTTSKKIKRTYVYQ